MSRRILGAMVAVAAAMAVVLVADLAISAPRTPGAVGNPSPERQTTASDGVYTEEQAERGKRAYERECGTCHGVDLRGGETAISLMGRDFMQYWAGESLGILYAIIQETMPEDDPGRLSPGQTTDLIAMMLLANGMPAGDVELVADQDALFEVYLPTAAEPQ